MNTTTITKHFPESVAVLQHQNGAILDDAPPGISVTLTLILGVPVGAEVESTDGSLYAEIGLTIENNSLVDYDGVFDLPSEVVSMLAELGINVAYITDNG